MNAYLFPGQGAQTKGMGGELFDEFDFYTRTADDVLGYSIKTLCIDDPQHRLNDTRYTQPALFVVNTLHYLKALQHDPTPPVCVAGHSLGEYNALLAAGVFRFDVGLRIVKQRAELMSQAPAGGMAAVIDCPVDALRRCLDDARLDGIDIANYNADSQIVIAGAQADLAAAYAAFDAQRVRYVPLKVSAAFHSRHMAPMQDTFRAFLRDVPLQPLKVPVIANLDAQPYRDEYVIERLSAQLCGAVRWRESVLRMRALGATHFVEAGPGDVLTKLNGKIA
ncbi:ACP S-malonyltransferase [Burkholderia pyrrocinia]